MHDCDEIPGDTTVVEICSFSGTIGAAAMHDRSGAPPRPWNASHTRGLTLLAASSARVGVDAEAVRHVRDLDALARRSMLDDEYAQWAQSEDRVWEFFRHWTRVEAYLKAIEVGITGGLRTRPPVGWTIVDLDVGPFHCAAVAVEASDVVVTVRSVGTADIGDDADDVVTPTPIRRFAGSALGAPLGAAMIGLGRVLVPRSSEVPEVVVQADAGEPDRERVHLALDPDDPAASVVTIRPWIDRSS